MFTEQGSILLTSLKMKRLFNVEITMRHNINQGRFLNSFFCRRKDPFHWRLSERVFPSGKFRNHRRKFNIAQGRINRY